MLIEIVFLLCFSRLLSLLQSASSAVSACFSCLCLPTTCSQDKAHRPACPLQYRAGLALTTDEEKNRRAQTIRKTEPKDYALPRIGMWSALPSIYCMPSRRCSQHRHRQAASELSVFVLIIEDSGFEVTRTKYES